MTSIYHVSSDLLSSTQKKIKCNTVCDIIERKVNPSKENQNI